MTPTLTNAQKYSLEFGFEPGVVVEVTTIEGITVFGNCYTEDTRLRIVYYMKKDGWFGHEWIYLDDIKSIRLLSGKWAVWQFAPKNAIGVVHDFEANFILFYNNSHTDFDAHVKKHMGLNRYTYLPAPWWWLDGQK
jgi:hypothetical protein